MLQHCIIASAPLLSPWNVANPVLPKDPGDSQCKSDLDPWYFASTGQLAHPWPLLSLGYSTNEPVQAVAEGEGGKLIDRQSHHGESKMRGVPPQRESRPQWTMVFHCFLTGLWVHSKYFIYSINYISVPSFFPKEPRAGNNTAGKEFNYFKSGLKALKISKDI